MFEQNEIVTLVLGTGCMVFLLLKKLQLKRIPFSNLLFISYYCLFSGWTLSVLEGFFWHNFINIIEHVSYVSSSVFLALWCWNQAFIKTGHQ